LARRLRKGGNSYGNTKPINVVSLLPYASGYLRGFFFERQSANPGKGTLVFFLARKKQPTKKTSGRKPVRKPKPSSPTPTLQEIFWKHFLIRKKENTAQPGPV